MIETAEAVQHAHMRGILHRDLKPANILIDEQGHPHITDFGLAKLIESDVELTASGAIMGTPAYMSPEQAAGRRGAITTATDVYGLGAIFYALLTGKAPFGGESVIETLDAVRTRLPEPPTKRNAKVPRDLELICLKCLEKNPADRYPTAGALADDLRRLAAGEPVSVRAAGAVERVAKWARRKPTLAAAYTLGLLALLLGGLGGAAVWQWRAAARARDVAATARAAAEQARRRPEARPEQADGEARPATRRPGRRANSPARSSPGSSTAGPWKWPTRSGGRTTSPPPWPCSRAPGPTSAAGSGATSSASAIPTCSRSRGTPVPSIRRRSAPTARGSSPPVTTGRRRSGTPRRRRGPHAQGAHRIRSRSASFSPDGSRIVTASTDKTAKVWDARTGAEVLTLKGHTGQVTSASFSPDGSRIVTGE